MRTIKIQNRTSILEVNNCSKVCNGTSKTYFHVLVNFKNPVFNVKASLLSVCAAGTEGDGVTCTDCVLSYQPGGVPRNVSCIPCPPSTNAPKRATSASDCIGNE